MNIFDESNSRINEFVSKKENSRLKFGTGRYSTLFRGTLFGETETNKIVEKLQNGKKVKVLWLGSNPNVPKSLEAIKANGAENHYQDFLTQKQSGYFSEVFDDKDGKFHASWDPINNPNYGWKFYTEILEKIYGVENILMANFVPWGSKSFEKLLNGIADIDESLLSRMLEFSKDLNKSLIKELKPELVIVPKSIINSRSKNWDILSKKNTLISKKIKAKVSFIFELNQVDFDNCSAKILIVPHPSWTPRIGTENRKRVQNEVKEALSKK